MTQTPTRSKAVVIMPESHAHDFAATAPSVDAQTDLPSQPGHANPGSDPSDVWVWSSGRPENLASISSLCLMAYVSEQESSLHASPTGSDKPNAC